MTSVTRFLENKLRLQVNEEKSLVASVDKTVFPGFTFKDGKIRWSDKALRKFKQRVKELTGRSWFVSSEYYRPSPLIDQWLRRRVRMCY